MQQPPELLAYKALQAVQRGNAEELAKLIEAGANAHVINAVVKTSTSPNGRPDRVGRPFFLDPLRWPGADSDCCCCCFRKQKVDYSTTQWRKKMSSL